MKMVIKENKKEFVIDPDDVDLISTADKELNNLDNSKKELIESILELKLSNCMASGSSDPLLKSSLGSSLKAVLSSQSVVFLLTMIHNHRSITISLDKLDKEKLITKKTNEFVLKLSAKYGSILEDLTRITDDPYRWGAMSISPIISSKNDIDLYVQIRRMDRQVEQFVIDISESVLISKMLLERAIETTELIDKELIMSFRQKDIDKLEELTAKIKDLRKSVELDTKQIEQPDVSSLELAPESDN